MGGLRWGFVYVYGCVRGREVGEWRESGGIENVRDLVVSDVWIRFWVEGRGERGGGVM